MAVELGIRVFLQIPSSTFQVTFLPILDTEHKAWLKNFGSVCKYPQAAYGIAADSKMRYGYMFAGVFNNPKLAYLTNRLLRIDPIDYTLRQLEEKSTERPCQQVW